MSKRHFWVDADACPTKEEIITVAFRFEVELTFVSSQPIKSLMGREGFALLLCEQGDDVVDDQLVELSHSGDLVITADLLLAKRLLDQAVTVVNFQGQLLNGDAVKESMGTRQIVLAQLDDVGHKRSQKKGRSKSSVFKEGLHNICVKRYSMNK